MSPFSFFPMHLPPCAAHRRVLLLLLLRPASYGVPAVRQQVRVLAGVSRSHESSTCPCACVCVSVRACVPAGRHAHWIGARRR